MYLLLVYSLDRVQTRFAQEVNQLLLPKLNRFELEAGQNKTDAERQMAGGGPSDVLKANISAAKTTIEACQCFARSLREQRDAINRQNEGTKKWFMAAVNTYKTVCLSLNVGDMINRCHQNFLALNNIKLPRLRPFQGLRLKEEMRRLSIRMIEA